MGRPSVGGTALLPRPRHQCGWDSPPPDILAAIRRFWRTTLEQHPQAGVIREALRLWARTNHLEDYLYLRFPPAFIAAAGEAVAWVLSQDYPHAVTTVPWDLEVLAAARHESAPSPFQVYTTWLRVGVPGVPTREALLRDWTTEDRMVCERDFGGCITPALLSRMQAKRVDPETEANGSHRDVRDATVVDGPGPCPPGDGGSHGGPVVQRYPSHVWMAMVPLWMISEHGPLATRRRCARGPGVDD